MRRVVAPCGTSTTLTSSPQSPEETQDNQSQRVFEVIRQRVNEKQSSLPASRHTGEVGGGAADPKRVPHEYNWRAVAVIEVGVTTRASIAISL
jgi:hypothetical protein